MNIFYKSILGNQLKNVRRLLSSDVPKFCFVLAFAFSSPLTGKGQTNHNLASVKSGSTTLKGSANEMLATASMGSNAKGNFTSFSHPQIKTNAEVKQLNKGHENDPELGILYSNAPSENCFEILGKRNATQKYFVEEGTNGSKFIIQTASSPIHYKDNSGVWRTITDHLEKDNVHAGVFATRGREINIRVNTQKKYTTVSSNAGSISFNRDLELIYIKPDGTEQSLGKANWSKYTIGDDGIEVKDAWTGIDIQAKVLVNGLKTNFTINKALPAYASGKIVLRDHLQMDKGFRMDAPKDVYSGAISFKNTNGSEAFTMQKAIAYEAANAKNTTKNLNYIIHSNNELDIEVPGALLNKSASSYPVVIDPLVTGSVSVPGFTYSATIGTAYCSTTTNVTVPAGATLTDVQVTYRYTGLAGTNFNQAGFSVLMNGGCGTAYTAFAGGADGIGGTPAGYLNQSIWGTVSACAPAFSCSSYTLPFELRTSQNFGPTAACVATNFASATNFIVNVFGSAAIPPTITPAGPSTLCMPNTLTLTGSPVGGVWNSSAPAVAGVVGGLVTGAGTGTANISYTSGGCTAVNVVTVGSAPSISGTTAICYTGSVNDTTDLTGTPAGGTWTSGTTTVATVLSATVNPVRITAAGPGTTIITYNTGTCSATVPVNVVTGTASAPFAQPSGITFAGTSTTGTTVNFTTTTADGYLVIASTSPTLSITPTNGTAYATGVAFGGGKVINGSTTGSTPSYTTTLLNSNTHYYVFVFAFNNNCSGPQYNVVAPLSGNFTTCIAAPTGLATGTVGVNTVVLNWTASAIGGGYSSPITYIVQAYTDAGLTTPVPGYPVSVGAVTTYTVSSLTGGIQYWFTVKPVDACGNVSNTVTATTVCSGSATIPYIQTFDVSPTIGYLSPNCMGENVSTCPISGVQNNITAPGSISGDHTTGSGYFYCFPYNGFCGGTFTNQWLITPKLTFVAGTTYTLSFWYRVSAGSGGAWSSIRAQYSLNGTPPASGSATMTGGTNIGLAVSGTTTTTWAQFSTTFNPGPGTFYIGIDAASPLSGVALAIDDIEICAQPSAITASNGTAPYCAPATIDLATTTGTNVTSYQWTGPGGFTSSLTNPITVNTATGTFVYSVTGYNDPPSFGYGGLCSYTATTPLTVNATPAAITGTTALCAGTPVTLGETSTGGTWTVTPTTIATITATGVVTGIAGASGTAIVSYTTTGPCAATTTVTVSPGVPIITPAAGGLLPTRCPGINTVLNYTSTNVPTTYSLTWTGSPVGLPNVPAGTTLPPSPMTIVDNVGLAPGTYTGTMVVSNACGPATAITLTFNVIAVPPAINGSVNICIGATSTLTDSASGGTWSSINVGVATVGITNGVVTGISAGTAGITYSVGPSCFVTTIATVNPNPVAIVGANTVCLGGTTSLTDATSGGTWLSSNTAIATVNASGVVTGVGGGTDTITYMVGTCYSTLVITVQPAIITGTGAICVGATLNLSDAMPGGTWLSATGTFASVSGTGLVTGLAPGNETISYTLGGCTATTVVTVNTTPTAITGTLTVCRYATTTLSEAVAGGTWSSVTGAIASVSGTGVVTGIAPGTDTIKNTIGSCVAFVVVTVNPAPVAITGTLTVCQFDSTTLTDATPGGTWSSVNTGIATVSVLGTGVTTGVTAGTDTISYTIGSCTTTAVVTVNTAPTPITGTLSFCRYSTTTLTETVSGAWTSVTGAIAIVAGGVVTGVGIGADTIKSTIGSCVAYVVVTVNPAPVAIAGTLTVCQYDSTTLTDATPGGTWSSVNPGIAHVSILGTGVTTGVTAGADTISYTIGSCTATVVVTVNTAPVPITGTLTVCQFATTTLADVTPGGTWSSGTTAIATVDPIGDVTGVALGTSLISYAIGTCVATATVTVHVAPGAIGGNAPLCTGGGTITLNNTVAGGTWSGGTAGIATVNPVSGVVTPGGTAGTTIITYSTGCGTDVYATVTVNTAPAPIGGGPFIVCVGSSITLTDAITSGGSWTSGTPGVATIGVATGIVNGVAQGTSTIVYSTGCLPNVTAVVTVHATPAAILGNTPMCTGGATMTLTNTSTGGTWSGGTVGIATVNPATGVVTPGGTAGTTIITYSTGCGTDATVTVTVNTAPAPIGGGPFIVCVGSSITLTDAITSGGSWTSGTPGVATIGVATGIVNGVAQGTSTIVYSTGCLPNVTAVVTVHATPAAILGNTPMCTGGATMTLTNTSTGGTWSGGTVGIATVNPATGVVTPGGTAGTTIITYSTGCGTDATVTVTVNTAPVAIIGNAPLCFPGTTITLTETATGGTWLGGSGAIATINAATGVVTPMGQGVTTISYTNNCGTSPSIIVTVNAVPTPIVGTLTVCVGAVTSLTESATGGTWTSGSTSVATVNPVAVVTGVVTGISGGTSIITYSNGCGAAQTVTVTVNIPPAAITYSPSLSICIGGTTTLSNTSPYGTWSSITTPVATINPTGVVTGISQGTSIILYSTGCGTAASILIAVNANPVAIAGDIPMCTGSVITLTDGSTGGSWSGGTTGIATVNPATGIVTSGTTQGTATISYSNGCGSPVGVTVTVNAAPATIGGNVPMCVGGSTIALTETSTGGTWSGGGVVASVGATTGVVSPSSQGTATVQYSNGCGVPATVIVTVNASPAAITGNLPLCTGGATITLNNTSTGGTWSGGAVGIASVNPITGVVTSGTTQGTAIISYSNSCGTPATTTVTVNASPATIGGNSPMCTGGTPITLTNSSTGGTWSGGTAGIATVNPATGVVTPGATQGTATISYSNSCGSVATIIVTVNGTPTPIANNTPLCTGGGTITLLDAATGGTWSGGAVGIASVNPITGVVTGGTTQGTAIITYSNGCGSATATVTVNTPPLPITGNTGSICVGGITLPLTDGISGGTWTSTTTTVATVNPASGLVTSGAVQGTTIISYSTGCGTPATTIVTVNGIPAPITGTLTVCVGSNTTLSDISTAGTWSSSATTIATVNAVTGVVTGMAYGVATISYSNGCGAAAVASVTVNIPPTAILTNSVMCTSGTSITLTDAVTGGSWSGGTAGIATVGGSTGVVTPGGTQGTATITYSTGCGAAATTIVTVNSAPSPIIGVTALCAGGATITLTETASGGTWTSSTPSVATVGTTTGIVTSVGTVFGTTTITYTNNCGSITKTITVNALPVMPAPITSSTSFSVCVGATIPLSDVTFGGIWSSVFPAMATVSPTGIVTGVSAGTDTIKYTMTTPTCGSQHVSVPVTINPLPVAGVIAGQSSICNNTTATYTDTAIGGVWSVTNSTLASINTSGVVTAHHLGTDTIKYTMSSSFGCLPSTVTKIITIDTFPTTPGVIVGSTKFCQTATITLTDDSTGGKWNSSDTTIAKVDSMTGIVRGIAGGVVTISYQHTNNCGTAFVIHADTVKPLPAMPGAITGQNYVCNGMTITLSDTSMSGFWVSSDVTKATVDASGVVSWVSPGTVIISYADTNSCGTVAATDTIAVTPIPFAGSIVSSGFVCVGSTTTFTDTVAGGSWVSLNTSIATVSATGIVNGVDSGTTTILYIYTNACGTDIARDTIIVHPHPNAGIIVGDSILCNSSLRLYTDSISGGTWSSSSITIFSISYNTGWGQALTYGTAVVSYSVPYVCGIAVATQNLTINPLPSAGVITGLGSVCAGNTITLADTSSGGTWSASNGRALVSATGIVTAVSAGLDTIRYSVTNSCGTSVAIKVVTINPLPYAGVISGFGSACVGARDSLHESILGGIWTISNGKATIDTYGVITGVTAGLDTVTYTVTNGCGTTYITQVITINPLPVAGAITGLSSVCVNATITLTPGFAGGTWGSVNGNATVAGGIVTGIAFGTDSIYYVVSNVCGSDTARHGITINPVLNPGTISGLNTVCQNATITLTDTATSGAWSSVNSNASVSTGGIVIGLIPGNDTIVFSKTNMCGTFKAKFPITINPLPNAGTIYNITGDSLNVCIGASITIKDTTVGGNWFIKNTHASFSIVTGIVQGLTPGTDTIFYVKSNMCGIDTAFDIFNIYSLPSTGNISGHARLCKGVLDTMHIYYFGGTWISTDTTIAKITGNNLNGYLSTLSQGVDTIKFTTNPTVSGCRNSTKFVLTVLDTADYKIVSSVTDMLCYGTKIGSIDISLPPIVTGTSVGPFNYSWSNNATTLNNNNLDAGLYYFNVTETSTKCALKDSFLVTQPDSVAVDVTIKNDTCKTNNGAIWLAVTGGVAPYSYEWSNNTTDTFLLALAAGTYSVTLTDHNNCVQHIPIIVAEGICLDIEVHDGISPNGDGINDVWVIKGLDDYPNNSVQVFDKWGDVVFEKTHYNNDWDARGKSGSILPAGTYFYIIKLNTVNGAGPGYSNVKTGSILIKY